MQYVKVTVGMVMPSQVKQAVLYFNHELDGARAF